MSTAALGFAFQKIVLLKWVTISKNSKGMILNFVQVIRIRVPGLRHSMLLLEAVYQKKKIYHNYRYPQELYQNVQFENKSTCVFTQSF